MSAISSNADKLHHADERMDTMQKQALGHSSRLLFSKGRHSHSFLHVQLKTFIWLLHLLAADGCTLHAIRNLHPPPHSSQILML